MIWVIINQGKQKTGSGRPLQDSAKVGHNKGLQNNDKAIAIELQLPNQR